jgi:hypothetical protein
MVLFSEKARGKFNGPDAHMRNYQKQGFVYLGGAAIAALLSVSTSCEK